MYSLVLGGFTQCDRAWRTHSLDLWHLCGIKLKQFKGPHQTKKNDNNRPVFVMTNFYMVHIFTTDLVHTYKYVYLYIYVQTYEI